MTSTRAKNFWSAILLAIYFAHFGTAAAAQSITIGPPRPGGNPSTISNSSFPNASTSIIAPGGSVQRGTIAVADPSASITTGNITVVNSALVRVRWLGDSSTGHGGCNCGAAESLRLSVNTVDGTHVTLTATRAATAAGVTATASYEVTDLNPLAIKSIQRGTNGCGGATSTITAVTTGKTELDKLGQLGVDASGATYFCSLVLTNSTTITGTSATGQTNGWQTIETN